MYAFLHRHFDVMVVAYAFFALVTFGHLYRFRRALSAGSAGTKLAKTSLLALAWPAYWIVVHGVTATLKTATEPVSSIFVREIEVIGAIWFLGALLFPAYYIGSYWDQCASGACSLVVGKAFLWAAFWPAYLLIG
jgi:hypothetical protein